jgi:replication factor C large subunit
VAFVTGSGESTNKVESIVEDAQERREEQLEANTGNAFAGRVDSEPVPLQDTDDESDDGSGADRKDSAVPENTSEDPESTGENDDQAGLEDFI